MFTDETRREIAAIANHLELEPEALAIAEVESGGQGFAIVGGRPGAAFVDLAGRFC
jgi:hypothetical protein